MKPKVTNGEFFAIVAICTTLGLLLFPACLSRNHKDDYELCQQNLKMIGEALRMYAGENGGSYPPLNTSVPDIDFPHITTQQMMFDASLVYPKYLGDLSDFICPCDTENKHVDFVNPTTKNPDPSMVDDRSYTYLAWATDSRKHGVSGADIYTPFTEALRQFVKSDKPNKFEQNLEIEVEGNKFIYPRLNSGLWKNDPSYASGIPVIFDNVMQTQSTQLILYFNHIPGGSHVLYADGHVGFESYCPPLGGCSFPSSVINPMVATFLGELRFSNPYE